MGKSRRTSTGGLIGTRYGGRLPEIRQLPESAQRECLHVDKSLRERQSTSFERGKRERRRERLWSRLELGYGGENLESRDSNRERL